MSSPAATGTGEDGYGERTRSRDHLSFHDLPPWQQQVLTYLDLGVEVSVRPRWYRILSAVAATVLAAATVMALVEGLVRRPGVRRADGADRLRHPPVGAVRAGAGRPGDDGTEQRFDAQGRGRGAGRRGLPVNARRPARPVATKNAFLVVIGRVPGFLVGSVALSRPLTTKHPSTPSHRDL